MITLTGGCHCRAVRFSVTVPSRVVVHDCNCSICAKTGYLHLVVDAAALKLETGGDAMTEYRFNAEIARHLFCKVCGIKSFYVPRSHPDGFSVNWRALDTTDGVVAEIIPYDGRNWEAARRSMAD